NARGLDVHVEDVSESTAAIALQGPLSRSVLEAATGDGPDSWAGVGYYHRRPATVGDIQIDVSRTGYTGDLGYEVGGNVTEARGRRVDHSPADRPACLPWTWRAWKRA